MKQLGSIANNTGYTGTQFLSEFHSHAGIILSVDSGVMTIITHGSNDGTINRLSLIKRLIEKYQAQYIIEIVCCYSKQVFCVNPILWDYIKYPSIQTQIRMDCRIEGKIIFSVYD